MVFFQKGAILMQAHLYMYFSHTLCKITCINVPAYMCTIHMTYMYMYIAQFSLYVCMLYVFIEAEVMKEPGVIRAFSDATTSFMLQSIPISKTSITEVPSSLGEIDSSFKVSIGDNVYTVERDIVSEKFPMLYVAQSQKKRRKILKVSFTCTCTS